MLGSKGIVESIVAPDARRVTGYPQASGMAFAISVSNALGFRT